MRTQVSTVDRAKRSQAGVTLIELLVAIVIAGIVSTMMLTSWFALQRSYANTVTANDNRDNARQAMSRMVREIRDVESQTTTTEAAVLRARAWWIEFTTTFNTAGNQAPTLAPHLVLYRLYQDGTLWRFEDVDGNGTIANIDLLAPDPGVPNPGSGPNFNLAEQTTGEGRELIARNIVNATIPYVSSTDPTANGTTPLFKYSYIDGSGIYQLDPKVTGTDNRSRILGVQIHILVDLNPAKAPVYADLLSTVQLRNQRQF